MSLYRNFVKKKKKKTENRINVVNYTEGLNKIIAVFKGVKSVVSKANLPELQKSLCLDAHKYTL